MFVSTLITGLLVEFFFVEGLDQGLGDG